MDDLINSYNLQELSGRDSCLLKEWQDLDNLCSKRKAACPNSDKPSIVYVIRKKNVIGLPTEYEIWYRCKSIIGVKDTDVPREPIFGYLHKMRIELPNNYPSADGNPIFTFLTDIWHPNIRHSGKFKGHVCLTIKYMGVMASLKSLVLRVEQYLKYQLYHAKNTPPFPEDLEVAEWVREEGEPNGWTHFEQDVPENNVSLMQNEETHNNEEFIVALTLPDQYEYEVKVNPHEYIRRLIYDILKRFDLPIVDLGGHPIQYLLGKMAEDGDEPKILDFKDEDNREQCLYDYQIHPGDHLCLMRISNNERYLYIEVDTCTHLLFPGVHNLHDLHAGAFLFARGCENVEAYLKAIVGIYNFPIYYRGYQLEYSLWTCDGEASKRCEQKKCIGDYISDCMDSRQYFPKFELRADSKGRRHFFRPLMERVFRKILLLIYS